MVEDKLRYSDFFGSSVTGWANPAWPESNLIIEEWKDRPMKASKTIPANKREDKNDKKAFARTSSSVKPVAKDTNKTRRKMVKPTGRGK